VARAKVSKKAELEKLVAAQSREIARDRKGKGVIQVKYDADGDDREAAVDVSDRTIDEADADTRKKALLAQRRAWKALSRDAQKAKLRPSLIAEFETKIGRWHNRYADILTNTALVPWVQNIRRGRGHAVPGHGSARAVSSRSLMIAILDERPPFAIKGGVRFLSTRERAIISLLCGNWPHGAWRDVDDVIEGECRTIRKISQVERGHTRVPMTTREEDAAEIFAQYGRARVQRIEFEKDAAGNDLRSGIITWRIQR
jgi:hypothetical protein